LAQELAKLKSNGDVQSAKIAEAFIASRKHDSRKAEIFKELQDFADEYADVTDASLYTDQVWKSATQPLRISDGLTPEEANRLLASLGQITGFDKYRTNEAFRRAIQLVREYESPAESGSVDWWHIFDEVPGLGGPPNQGQMTEEEFMALGRDQDGDDKEPARDGFGGILVDEGDK
ncbi:MAG: hypothetical protein H0T51_12590, partial [Pirellulales bacterium]|nr:hypothetical protein [Pirellulales bacterium]